MSFANLKKNSSNLDKLTKAAVEALNKNKVVKDEGWWKAEIDKSGNGYAVIRFLSPPAVDGEDALPWVKWWDHGFQGPGGLWYIENSLTTLGQADPVSEHNSALWATGLESNKEIVRKQKRRLHYAANIYIVEDSKHPENQGKVFKYKFGTKIFEKITSAMNPEFEDEKPLKPFDLWNGANFKLKIRKVEGYQNYDKSEFEAPSALLDDDKELEKVYNSLYSLKEIVSPDKFKSYDQLKKQMEKVLGLTGAVAPAKTTVESARAKPKAQVAEEPEAEVVSDESDLDYFANLADAE